MSHVLNRDDPLVVPIGGQQGAPGLLQIAPYQDAITHQRGFIVEPTDIGHERLNSFWRTWYHALIRPHLSISPRPTVARTQAGVAVTASLLPGDTKERLRQLLYLKAADIRSYSPHTLLLERRDPRNLPASNTSAEWLAHADGDSWYRAIGIVVKNELKLPKVAHFYWWTSEQMYYGKLPKHDHAQLDTYGTAATARLWGPVYPGAILIYDDAVSLEQRRELAEKVEYTLFDNLHKRA